MSDAELATTACRRCGSPKQPGKQCLACRRRKKLSTPLAQINATDWLPIVKAAPLMGISTDTLRRRIRQGDVEFRLVKGRNGPTYVVRVDAEQLKTPPATIGQLIVEHDEIVAEADALAASVPRRIWTSFAVGVLTGCLATAIPVVALYLRGLP